MTRFPLVPTPDRIWKVSPRLDARRSPGERALVALNDAERMWVEVTEVDRENARYRGTLANDPMLHDQIACGDELWFHPVHVFALESPKESGECALD